MTVVDLDGTLVTCNSFTEFVKFLFRRFPCVRVSLIKIVALRKMRIISHHGAKERIVAIASNRLSAADIDDFVESLCKRINRKVRDIIGGSAGALLATAAPEMYVERFAAKVGISEFCATEQGKPENKERHKLDNILKSGVVFDENMVVVTDHSDDIPLLRANRNGVNYIVNPSRRTLKLLRQEGIRFDVI